MKIYWSKLLKGVGLICLAILFLSMIPLSKELGIRPMTIADVDWTGNQVIDKQLARSGGEWNFTYMMFSAMYFATLMILVINGIKLLKKSYRSRRSILK